MGANHLDNIAITLLLAAGAAPEAGFGTLLLIMDEASGTTLDGDRVRTYSSLTDAEADETSGFLSAAAVAAITAAFSQTPRPEQIKIGRCDTGGGETYADALSACVTADPDFYGVAIDSRADADILAVATPVQAMNRVLFAQSDDADWLTSGYPAGLTALEGDERTFICYHDDDSEWMDVAWAAGILAYDPDVQSAPWDRSVAAVASYSSLPTDTQKSFLDANEANHGLPYGSATFFVDPGVNANDRPGYEILSVDWFMARLEEAIATLKVNASARGEKITVSLDGGSRVLAEIEALIARGLAAQHFEDGVASLTTPTAADRAAQRLRFEIQLQIAVSARIFNFTLNVSTESVAS